MGKVVTVHQTVFAPYLGVISKVKESDSLVMLDDVEFTKSGFIHRNKFIINGKPQWVTIPVKSNSSRSLIKEMVVDTKDKLFTRGLNQIRESYRKAPYFEEVFPILERAYSYAMGIEEITLSHFNTIVFFRTLEYLGILSNTELAYSSAIDIDYENATEMNMEYVKQMKGRLYLSGKNGKDYMDQEIIKEYQDITVLYQEYEVEEYPQFNTEEFVPYMSVFDYMFNMGNNLQNI